MIKKKETVTSNTLTRRLSLPQSVQTTQRITPMNRLRMIGLILMVIISSCHKEEEEQTLDVSHKNLTFVGIGESHSINISSSSTLWSWEGEPKWVYVKKIDNKTARITALPNSTDEGRLGKVVFVNGEIKRIITLEQSTQPKAPVEYYIKAKKSKVEFDDIDEPIFIEVETNAPKWHIEDYPEWLYLSAKDKKLEIQVNINTEETPRTGKIVLTAKDARTEIEVSQAAKAYVRLSKEFKKFHYLGEDQATTFESNREVKIKMSSPHDHFEVKDKCSKRLVVGCDRNVHKGYAVAYLSFEYKDRTLLEIKLTQDKSRMEEDQRKYLTEFFNATNGKSWKNNTNWLSDKPLSEWYGVKMTEYSPEVFSLNLQDNNLTGYIPRGFSILVSARFIKLQNNSISGEIPEEIKKFTNVTRLDLSNNNFEGTIPNSFCEPRIRCILDLRGNRLRGNVPDCLRERRGVVKICPQQAGYNFDNFDCNDPLR